MMHRTIPVRGPGRGIQSMLQRVTPRFESMHADDLVETSRKLTELGLKLFSKGMEAKNAPTGPNLDDPLGLAQASLASPLV